MVYLYGMLEEHRDYDHLDYEAAWYLGQGLLLQLFQIRLGVALTLLLIQEEITFDSLRLLQLLVLQNNKEHVIYCLCCVKD
jgi:hypothetical protein